MKYNRHVVTVSEVAACLVANFRLSCFDTVHVANYLQKKCLSHNANLEKNVQ